MELRRLSAEQAQLRRFVEESWLPYHRDLEAAADAHALADRPDASLVDENVEFYRDLLAEADRRAWVAVESAADRDGDGDAGRHADDDGDIDPATAELTHPGLEFVGHLLTSVDECPVVFDRPDRLVVGDIYVAEPYRGTDLAHALIQRAAADAREQDCPQLRLDVDVDNGRALAFYENCGFEEYRRQLTVDTDGLSTRE